MMAGLTWGQTLDATSPRGLLIAALGLAGLALATIGRPRLWAVSITGAMVLAGVASQELHRRRPPEWELRPAREAKLSLRITRTFPAPEAHKVSGLAVIVKTEAHLRELVGQRVYFSLITGRHENAPIRTMEISAGGVLAVLPKNPPIDSFDGYLANAGINFRLQRGRALATEKAATTYARFCARAVERFKKILSLGIAGKRPELAALLRAMMLGETHELSEEQHALFRESGTMHLFAISGMNIAVIAGALQVTLLLPLRRWPAINFGVGVLVLWLFVDITGAAPSAVRAFSMAVFVQGALAWWKPANVLAALAASALLVLVAAPLQFFSASFVMSYGIVAALLLLGIPLGETWAAAWSPGRQLPKATWRWWHHAADVAWRWLTAALAVGAASTLVGLLAGVRYFGLLTPGAIVTNLLLISAATSVTLSGFGSLVMGLIGWDVGAAFCNHASAVVLLGIEKVVRLSVMLPGAFMPAKFLKSWLGGWSIVTLGAWLIAGYALGWRRSIGGFWGPFVLVGAVLLLAVQFG